MKHKHEQENKIMSIFTRKAKTSHLTGDHIAEYVVAEPGCPKVRVVRGEHGWAVRVGTLFSRTHAILTDRDDAIDQARRLSMDLRERARAEAAERKAREERLAR